MLEIHQTKPLGLSGDGPEAKNYAYFSRLSGEKAKWLGTVSWGVYFIYFFL
jgi:hypothetical protein